MADIVGGALLSAALQVLFDHLASDEFRFILSEKRSLIAEPVAELKIVLCSASSLLDDAEERQLADRRVADWLASLSEAISEADDLLDEIRTHYLSSSSLRTQRNSGKLLRLFSRISSSAFESEAKEKVEAILRKLKILLDQRGSLGLKKGFRQIRSFRRLPAPLVDECEVYGRDSEKDAILESLFGYGDSGSVRASVIPIVGMGGLGKTTLAQLVYLDRRVVEYFDLRIWVTVSDDFDLSRIMRSLLEGVNLRKPETEELFRLQIELRDALRGKRFLIVLDDVWNENHDEWDVLKSSFASAAYGSKVVVTTRSGIVASVMTTGSIHHLPALKDEDCWDLFVRNAFGARLNLEAHRDLEEIGREIVRKCKGLPLAVKSVAGVLRQEDSLKSWRNVMESDAWDLCDGGNVLPVLWLSYRYLPPHLKQCFSYCSIFPKDYSIKKEEMVLLWMAQGLVQPKGRKTIEEIGADYFHDLIERSLFQQASSDRSTLFMHDMVNDLAKYVAGEFCVRVEGNQLPGITKKVRHLSYTRARFEPAQKFEPLYDAKHLRTFLPLKLPSFDNFLTENLHYDLIPRLKRLRALSLSHYSNITVLPVSISELKHLRYLDVSHTAIKALPSSINALYNLQTLNLSYCSSLTQLPSKIGRLVNLRHLFNKGTNLKEIPVHICNLIELQTLTVFVLGKGKGANISELRQLDNLRGTLSIFGLQNVANAEDASEANLNMKKHLKELILQWDLDSEAMNSFMEFEKLQNLQPHTNLERLSIKNFQGELFPQWLGDPSFTNISFLSLTECKYSRFLPPLGELPSLRELSITGFDLVENVGHEFCGRRSSVQPYVSLEILRFSEMWHWKEWKCLEGGTFCGSFPSLRVLCIENCPVLTGNFPSQYPKLAELEIIGCPKLMVSINKAPFLYQLDLVKCDTMLLKTIPPELHWLTISGIGNLNSLPDTIGYGDNHLEELNISNCSSLKCLLEDGGIPKNLKVLGISGCSNLNLEFPVLYNRLQSLSISESCNSLERFPLHLFPSLNRLHIEACKNLKSLVFSDESSIALTSLTFLQISSCPNFCSFPKGGLRAPNLSWLCIEKCKNVENLPEAMESLISLQVLNISHCENLVSFPEEGFPINLSALSISFCKKLVSGEMKWNLRNLSLLRDFRISGDCENLESFPEAGLLPSTLTSLFISGFLNLKSLDRTGILHLKLLKELKIENCPKLRLIPEDGLSSSLRFIQISNCSFFGNEKRKTKLKTDWTRIAQNACIQIDNKVIW